MDRNEHRLRARRDIGLPNKQNTPLKKILGNRNGKKRHLLHRCNETLHEALEEKDINPSPVMEKHQVQKVAISDQRESKLRPVRPKFGENLRNNLKLSATPMVERTDLRTLKTNLQVNLIPKVLKSTGMQGEEEGHYYETITSSSVEPDTSSSSSEEEEEDPTFSSRLTSPEIFRCQSNAIKATHPISGTHLHNKNSTLLDVSYAKNIHMQHSPNVSTIIDTSIISTGTNCEVIHKRTPENKIPEDSSDQALRKNSIPNILKRRSIVFKKKVCFKSPIIADAFKAKVTPATTVIKPSIDSSHTSGPKEKLNPGTDPSRADEISSTEESLPLNVTRQRPGISSAAKVKFFDFSDEKEKDAFFQKMKERHVRLTSVRLYPFRSAHNV